MVIALVNYICDAFLQQIVLRPTDYDVIATMNLNGDYISDALAAMVGGIGIAPGANISDSYAVFEATHGTAPKYAGKNQVKNRVIEKDFSKVHKNDFKGLPKSRQHNSK